MRTRYQPQPKTYIIELEDFVADFYEKIAQTACLPIERVLADALFKTAGELVARANSKKGAG